jgi:hypothetical protein
MKTKNTPAMLPRFIAACVNLQKHRITSYNQLAFLSTVVAKEGMTYAQISKVLQGYPVQNIRCLAYRSEEMKLIRLEKTYEQVHASRGPSMRTVARVYPTPYLRDLIAILESDLWMK